MTKKPATDDNERGGAGNTLQWTMTHTPNEFDGLPTAGKLNEPPSDEGVGAGGETIAILKENGFPEPPLPLQTLTMSGIVETYGIDIYGNISDVVWRAGHLEHIANLFAGDPATTERNYADDLAVARAYSAETWERLTNG